MVSLWMKDEFSMVQAMFFHVGCDICWRCHEVASSLHPLLVPRICSQLQSATHWKKPAISPTFRQKKWRILWFQIFTASFFCIFFTINWHSAFSLFPLAPKGALSGGCGCPNGVTTPGSHGRLATILGGVYYYFILIPSWFFGKSQTNFWSKTQNHSTGSNLGGELTESKARCIDLTDLT